jgi:hypothetical protein
MSIDLGTDWIRVRARDAREMSATLREESLDLRLVAAELRAHGDSRRASRRQRASRRLEWETAAVGGGVLEWPAMGRFLEFDSSVVGRDPAIERAKTLLCDRYGVGRGEAFQILRSVSSRTNRKLRDVARGLVHESVGPAGPGPRG